MAQDRSTEIISMIERISRLSIQTSLSPPPAGHASVSDGRAAGGDRRADGKSRGAGSVHHLEKGFQKRELKRKGNRKVDIRQPGKGNSNSHDARLVY